MSKENILKEGKYYDNVDDNKLDNVLNNNNNKSIKSINNNNINKVKEETMSKRQSLKIHLNSTLNLFLKEKKTIPLLKSLTKINSTASKAIDINSFSKIASEELLSFNNSSIALTTLSAINGLKQYPAARHSIKGLLTGIDSKPDYKELNLLSLEEELKLKEAVKILFDIDQYHYYYPIINVNNNNNNNNNINNSISLNLKLLPVETGLNELKIDTNSIIKDNITIKSSEENYIESDNKYIKQRECEFKDILKITSKSLEIYPKLIEFVDRYDVQKFTDFLIIRNQYNVAMKIYFLFSNNILFDFKMLKNFTNVLIEHGAFMSCSALLKKECIRIDSFDNDADYKGNINSIDKDKLIKYQLSVNSLILQSIHVFIEADNSEAFKSSFDLIKIFDNSNFINKSVGELYKKLKYRNKRYKVISFVKKNKWQLALQIADSLPIQIDLYNYLREMCMYKESNVVYLKFNLQRYPDSVIPTTSLELKEQINILNTTYLLLKVPNNNIIIVDSISKIIQAAQLLGLENCLNNDENNDYFINNENQPKIYVGLDAEWKANMNPKIPIGGASILQVAILSHVFIFDLNTLGSESSLVNINKKNDKDNKTIIIYTNRLLSTLFQSEHIIKVGWGFNNSDISMLRISANGKFSSSFQNIRKLLELEKIILIYFSIGNKKDGNLFI
jgi:hypothetical protein